MNCEVGEGYLAMRWTQQGNGEKSLKGDWWYYCLFFQGKARSIQPVRKYHLLKTKMRNIGGSKVKEVEKRKLRKEVGERRDRSHDIKFQISSEGLLFITDLI